MVNEAISAARLLEKQGISAEIVKINRVSRAPMELALQSLRKTGKMIAAEEVCAADCLGERLLAQAAQREIHVRRAKLLNLGKGIVAHGDRKLLLRDHEIDAEAIARHACRLCTAGKDTE